MNGWDVTNSVPFDTLKPSLALGDTASTCDFEIHDQGSLIAVDIGMSVIVFDETLPGLTALTFGGALVPSTNVPTDNILPDPIFAIAGWTVSGTLAADASFFSNAFHLSFTNAALGSAFAQRSTPFGYVHAGQSYMLSLYVKSSVSPTNVTAYVKITWLDANSSVLSSVTNTFTPPPSTNPDYTRVTVSGVAPANTISIQAEFGGTTTVNVSNSATFVMQTLLLEPMYFAASQGASYPTAPCDFNQPTSYTLPDGTASRYGRVFAGYVDDVYCEYDGANRVWTVSCAGPDMVLDMGSSNGSASNINATFANSYDDQIIGSVVSTYFAGILSTSQANFFLPSPVVRGELIGNITYSDTTFREILNGLVDQSGFIVYADPYYRINYNPLYYNASPYKLTDNNALIDMVTYFPYHDYKYHKDGTQQKQLVKVIGGQFKAPAITNTFSGNGSNKVFTLTQPPYEVNSVTVTGALQLAGVAGVNTFAQGYAVLIDKANKTMTFNVAPPSAANNTVINFTFEAPVSVVVMGQGANNPPIAPNYVTPTFVQKVTDTSITDLSTAIDRGISELSKYGTPRLMPSLKANMFIQPGTIVSFTSTPDGIVNQPYVVWHVDCSALGGGTNEYSYQVGAYNPSITDHLRHHNKALSKSTTTANITAAQQVDIVINEVITFSETITITNIAASPNVYGTGIYGTSTYS